MGNKYEQRISQLTPGQQAILGELAPHQLARVKHFLADEFVVGLKQDGKLVQITNLLQAYAAYRWALMGIGSLSDPLRYQIDLEVLNPHYLSLIERLES